MKKNTLILLIGAALGIFAYRYYLIGGQKKQYAPVVPLKLTPFEKAAEQQPSSPITEPINVSASYLGPDLFHDGRTLRVGDILVGTLNPDNSMNFTLHGSGIAASSKVFVIPANHYKLFQF